MSSGKRRSPESKKRRGWKASATARSCSPPTASSTGTACGTRSAEPTDGATKSTMARSPTPTTSACQNTGKGGGFLPLRSRNQYTNWHTAQTSTGARSRTSPHGRVT